MKLIDRIRDFFKKLFSKKKKQEPDKGTQDFKFVSFGSPKCSNAVEDPNVQIRDLKWSTSELSFKWASKTKLEQWGINDLGAADALACFGYLDEKGTWRFAKIDWISSNRLSRDMENVHKRYNGIDPNAYFSAKQHGFFIMEANGRRRSNIIFA